jgi:hypothetical protein
VAAVPEGHGGDCRGFGVVRRRGACQQVAAGAFFVSRVVCEEVLEQPRRRLAWEPQLAEAGGTSVGTVPGAMSAVRGEGRACLGAAQHARRDGWREARRGEGANVRLKRLQRAAHCRRQPPA